MLRPKEDPVKNEINNWSLNVENNDTSFKTITSSLKDRLKTVFENAHKDFDNIDETRFVNNEKKLLDIKRELENLEKLIVEIQNKYFSWVIRKESLPSLEYHIKERLQDILFNLKKQESIYLTEETKADLTYLKNELDDLSAIV